MRVYKWEILLRTFTEKGYMKILKFYKDKKKQWRWKVIAQNGRILACSGEGYTRRNNAIRSFYTVVNAIHIYNIAIIIDLLKLGYKIEGLK